MRGSDLTTGLCNVLTSWDQVEDDFKKSLGIGVAVGLHQVSLCMSLKQPDVP